MSTVAPVHVLVVEDPKRNPEITLTALHEQASDIRVAVVNNGTAAQQFLTNCQTPPNVILLDMKLPDMEGIELLRYIRSNVRMKSLPVLVLIDPEDQTRKSEASGLGVNGYIPHLDDPALVADHLTVFRHLIAGQTYGLA